MSDHACFFHGNGVTSSLLGKSMQLHHRHGAVALWNNAPTESGVMCDQRIVRNKLKITKMLKRAIVSQSP